MATRFVPNPSFKRDLATDLAMRAALRDIAEDIADDAASRGQDVADSYGTEVTDDGGTLRVEANTLSRRGMNAAAWIEFGTANMPAYAPLRQAVEASSCRLGD